MQNYMFFQFPNADPTEVFSEENPKRITNSYVEIIWTLWHPDYFILEAKLLG